MYGVYHFTLPIMEFMLCLSLLMHLACWSLTALSSLSSSETPLCDKDDMSALLEFKNSFTISPRNLTYRSRVESWQLDPNNQTSSNCCSWKGVECEEGTGRVIALDLSGSSLFGSINSSSSLFRLVHLRSIDLSFNHFNYSTIPFGFGLFSGLTYLDLSSSYFSGQLPPDIFTLTRLLSLGLGSNDGLLELAQPGLTDLAHNLTSLEYLNLQGVRILSPVPDTFVNLSSLRSLSLYKSGVHGEFPASIFQLPNLEFLSLDYNPDLTIVLPEFNSTSPLKRLEMFATRFSGGLPTSIGNLQSLEEMRLGSNDNYCSLTGLIPSSMGSLRNLRQLSIRGCKLMGAIPSSFCNLTELSYLELLNSFVSPQNLSSLSWLGKLNNLGILDLGGMHLQGEIPPFVGNLSQLFSLDFSNNQLSGQIPSRLVNLGQLVELRIAVNELSGYIPSWLSNMTELNLINLAFNRLQGPVPSWITQLPNLMMLHLGWNQFSGMELDLNSSFPSSSKINPRFFSVGLASCNLHEFPSFLQNHPNLDWLDLSHNSIHGEVPTWMHGIGVNTLFFLNISNNYLTGFNPTLDFLPWNVLISLDLTSNMFLGSPPMLSLSPKVQFYLVANNNLTGAFPSCICNWSSLVILDLSFNNMSGSLPECLGNISSSLTVLNLQRNRFTGNLPQLYTSGLQLTMIALGHNNLLGRLPRSLANCSQLEFIDFGNNHIDDTFPSWLGSLPQLRVLILSHNKFHGVIPGSISGFKSVRIIDLSQNRFTGVLPEQFVQTLFSMTDSSPVSGQLLYMRTKLIQIAYLVSTYYTFYDFYMTLANKGLNLYYPKVSEIFAAINLSGNKLKGGIPDAIGNLKQLHSLNLSNNFLSGHIPSSMGNLSQLESLDLSLNKLSGEIPQELAELNSLSFLNMSYNNLTGEIPKGSQLDTFHDNSFEGNPGLCGDAVSKKCGSPQTETPEPSPKEEEDSDWFVEFDWKIVVMGHGSGIVIGVVIGCAFDPCKHGWFSELVERMQQKRRRQMRKRRRN